MRIDKKFYEADNRANDFTFTPKHVIKQLIDMVYETLTGQERRPDYSSYKERLNRSRAPEIKTEK